MTTSETLKIFMNKFILVSKLIMPKFNAMIEPPHYYPRSQATAHCLHIFFICQHVAKSNWIQIWISNFLIDLLTTIHFFWNRSFSIDFHLNSIHDTSGNLKNLFPVLLITVLWMACQSVEKVIDNDHWGCNPINIYMEVDPIESYWSFFRVNINRIGLWQSQFLQMYFALTRMV